MKKNSSSETNFVITADDFGISKRANSQIISLAKAGKLNRVAIMAFGKMSSDEIMELKETGVFLDIHLDILHELEDVRQKRSSALFRSIEFCLKVITGKISPNKVSQDWEAQVEKFQEIVGQYPDGINSHEHVHFFPPFFKVALKLKNKYAIPFIRFGDTAKLENPSMVAYIIHIMRIIDRKMFKKNTFMTTSSLVSLDWIKDVESFSKSSKKGDVEIVCHPEIAKDFSHIQRYF